MQNYSDIYLIKDEKNPKISDFTFLTIYLNSDYARQFYNNELTKENLNKLNNSLKSKLNLNPNCIPYRFHKNKINVTKNTSLLNTYNCGNLRLASLPLDVIKLDESQFNLDPVRYQSYGIKTTDDKKRLIFMFNHYLEFIL